MQGSRFIGASASDKTYQMILGNISKFTGISTIGMIYLFRIMPISSVIIIISDKYLINVILK